MRLLSRLLCEAGFGNNMLVGWQPTAKQCQMLAAARDIYAVGQAVVAVAFWSILQAIIK